MRFWKYVFFDEFFDWQEVDPKSQFSSMLAANVKKCGSFGRGRRERRYAGEEKEEGLCCRSSKIFAGEHSVKDSARCSKGGGGFKGYRLWSRPL